MARFDAENALDPRIDDVDGRPVPRELLYADRMSERLAAFAPEASEALRLAARCQHIRRWEIPRSNYPMDRMGYRRWRTELSAFHAARAREILLDTGYGTEMADRVADLVQKRRLKKDAESQILEDVVCLVFLEHYFDDFAGEHDEEKLVDIVRKTLSKMSAAAHEAADALPLSATCRQIVAAALRG